MQYTLPRIVEHDGIVEKRNKTYMEMIKSMISTLICQNLFVVKLWKQLQIFLIELWVNPFPERLSSYVSKVNQV